MMNRRKLLKLGLGGTALGLSTIAGAVPFCGTTPAQTEGPFYPVNEQEDTDWDLTRLKGAQQISRGEVVIVRGKVTGADCAPLAGTLVEIWQACDSGKYNHPNDPNPAPLDPHFQYWGKATTDQDGLYLFKTIIPGAYPAAENWVRPPHIHYKVHKWGYKELTTQLYFAGHKLNRADRILNQIPVNEHVRVVRPIENRTITLPGEAPKVYRTVDFDLSLEHA